MSVSEAFPGVVDDVRGAHGVHRNDTPDEDGT